MVFVAAYSRKTAAGALGGHIDVFLAEAAAEVAADLGCLVSSVRAAAAMVDAPASELTTTRCYPLTLPGAA